MGFEQTLKNSWKLVKGSLKLIWENPTLLIFPLLSILSFVIFFGIILYINFGSLVLATENVAGMFLLAGIFLLIFAAPFFGTFFAVALSYETGEVLKGRKPSVRRGIQHAIKNLKEIVLWAFTLFLIQIIAGILRSQARKYGSAGRVMGNTVIDILLAGWGFATAFVIPIMAFEDTNPFDSIKKSVTLLKHTWGETLVGGVGAGSLLGLLAIPLLVLLFIPYVGLFLLPFIILGLVLIGILTQVFNTVFITALYLYATEKDSKKAERYFDKDLIVHSFY